MVPSKSLLPPRMLVDVYMRPSCPLCVILKDALTARGIGFVEYDVSDETIFARVKNSFPEINNLPILAVKNTVIGGVDELVTLIQNDQVKYLS
jgi:glutaredoxin